MKTLTVRNIDDGIYDRLRELAKLKQRSIQEQVRWILAKETLLYQGSWLACAKHWREQLKDRNQGDSLADIREVRERR